MEVKIVWTEPALGDLEEIVTYISRDNPPAGARIGASIVEHVEILSSFPYIGPTYPRGASGRTREIVCGNYRIFYRVNESSKTAEILTVWHGARGEPTLPP
ncbi:MAG: type II toxin-antitoxin system RelE/ParE family toxin [Verrucomicrobiota bacterium]|jgi:plasmid stabilization system protein ParE